MSLRDEIANASKQIRRIPNLIGRAQHRISQRRDERERLNEKRRQLDSVLAKLVDRQEQHIKQTGERDHDLQDEIEKRRASRAQIRTRKEALTKAIRDAVKRIGRRQKRLRWWVAQRTLLRKKLAQAQRESHPHFQTWMLNGCPNDITDDIRSVIAYAVGKYGLAVTATTNGVHASTSWHYYGRAVDTAGNWDAMVGFQNFAAKVWTKALEIFGPDTFYIKNGVRYAGAFPDHGDHDHTAR